VVVATDKEEDDDDGTGGDAGELEEVNTDELE
jgi:hypothetical protein